MSNINVIALTVAFTLVVCTAAWSQQVRYFESFVDGVPDYFEASRPESLSISPWHYKHGNASLRWDWAAGDELVIHHGIGDVNRTGGLRARASFSVWLYMQEPVADALAFEFREGEEVTGAFRFPLEFSGWRQGRLFYHAFPEGRPTSQVDNIRIAAPTDTEQGTVFMDFIKYNTLTHGGNDVIPERVMQWRPPSPDEQRFPLPDRVTEEELAGIRKLMGPDEGPGIEQTRADELCEQVEALGIVRDEHGIRGPGIDAHYQFFATQQEQVAVGVRSGYWSDEHGPGWEGMQTPGNMARLANQIANAYRASNDAEQRERLAEAYLLIADHLHDQALQAGSGFRWHWWAGGAWADSVFLMRDVLKDAGRLEGHTHFLLYAYGAGAIFDERGPRSHMDFYNLTVPRLLRQCLLQVEPVEQVRWLNAFRAMLERSIAGPSSAFKIDGSAYHHAGHYPSYANGAYRSLSQLIGDFRGTPWQLDAETHDRVRRAILAQRTYCNLLDVPASLHGRSTFRHTRRINTAALHKMALCDTPDGRQEIDLEAAAAYLRLVPDAADREPYRDLGIEPEPHPQGTFVMPYAGLLSHRRDDWLVSVKGQNKYIWASERQDHHNRFGVFQGLGQLEILAGGSPVSAEASGRQGDGWDWARFEGITVPQLPQQRLAEAWSGGRTYSPETFMGGLSHKGSQGVFGMILNQTVRPDTTFTGRKSWFLNDNQIICLGSDIFCDEPQYPTQTTLCQKGLQTDAQGERLPTIVNGAEVSAFPEERALDPAEPHWFIDVQQTGYYLPAGQMVTVARRHQTSRSAWDEEDTEGDFLTAWIDHGTAPSDASYEYMLVVRATPEEMGRIAAEPPYRVIQRDQDAHIVWLGDAGRWGGVFFVEQEVREHTAGGQTLPVKAVDRPCLIMAEAAGDGQLDISVANPDLNMDPPTGNHVLSRPSTVTVTLRGQWRLLGAKGTVGEWELEGGAEDVRVVSSDADETVLEIVSRHGASYDISLTR